MHQNVCSPQQAYPRPLNPSLFSSALRYLDKLIMFTVQLYLNFQLQLPERDLSSHEGIHLASRIYQSRLVLVAAGELGIWIPRKKIPPALAILLPSHSGQEPAAPPKQSMFMSPHR